MGAHMKTNLTAADVMSPQPLMAYEGWSIKRLTEFFIKNNISGAPVIASDHSLVGVVTLSDIVKFDSKTKQEKSKLLDEVYAEFVGTYYDDSIKEELLSRADETCTVNKVMTPNVVQVDEKANLQEVAYIMLQHGIRRIFVSNFGIISGVISTSNILKAIAK